MGEETTLEGMIEILNRMETEISLAVTFQIVKASKEKFQEETIITPQN